MPSLGYCPACCPHLPPRSRAPCALPPELTVPDGELAILLPPLLFVPILFVIVYKLPVQIQ